MNITEAANILGLAATYDRRTIGDAEIVAWQAALSDVNFADAQTAVVAHYRDSTDWLMPAHVRHGAEAIDRERRRVEGRRLEIEYADREIAAAIERGPLRDRSAEVRALVNEIRGVLPDGNLDSLRYGHRHWREQRQRQERIRTAEPNPHYDPAAAARLAEMNAPQDMDIPESEPTP